MIFVDSDNALGSPRGDVDDAFAIAALLAARAPLAAISSCAGNTSEARAFENNRRLVARFGSDVPVIHGHPEMLRDFTGRVLALGPLTNIVHAHRAREIILVGGKYRSRVWPFDLNLTHDRAATRAVLALDVPLTVFPLDVARQLAITIDEVPPFLREESRRWFRHLLLFRFTRRFPVYDLGAALYVLGEDGFTFEERELRGRRVKMCTSLNRDVLWSRFAALPLPR